jgi:hypothetical protein
MEETDKRISQLERTRRRLLFRRLLLVISLALWSLVGWLSWRFLSPDPSGDELNELAWKQSFIDYKWPIPEGPREGLWGRDYPPVEDDVLGWRMAERNVPAMFTVNNHGVQTFSAGTGDKLSVMIVGGSVAGGAYASTEANTYFAEFAVEMAKDGSPVEISVLAAGAWTSLNEFAAVKKEFTRVNPDVIILLDGLNDLTCRVDLPLQDRVVEYRDNIKMIIDFIDGRSQVVMCLQPFLPHKVHKSMLEERIIELSTGIEVLVSGYEGLHVAVDGLQNLYPDVIVFDATDLFTHETESVFSDLWHFPDPGHRKLGQFLARECIESGIDGISE